MVGVCFCFFIYCIYVSVLNYMLLEKRIMIKYSLILDFYNLVIIEFILGCVYVF